ncbi:HD domain-containing protein [Pseudovibrio exalbescens]|uniref:HD domain-containing protein n=1 Tax=Pseudovibrio exalbescens TaxID=197461 RepID=UPI002365121F|nr:HD domain-containing protein [Pseudovibrio exalbescens]MDD7908443.1 HD domain-containing protein [Pseudovibrio exalbescens]
MSINQMGTLAWGRREGRYSRGRLTRLERLALVRNMAHLQLIELGDLFRRRLGLLQPERALLEELLPKKTALVDDALSLAKETHAEALLHHSWRTYLFGALLGRHAGLNYDPELLFASCILHDLGISSDRDTHPEECCFAVSGAERACSHLAAKGHDTDKVNRIGDAMALHLNAYVSSRLHGAEAHLVSRGAVCDLFGAGVRRLAGASVDEIMLRHPREGVVDALGFETFRHLPGTRAAVMTALAGGNAPKTPLDRYGS